MPAEERSVGVIWRVMRRLNPHLLERFRSRGKPSQFVLILRTVGRKSGREHITPLQYEQVGDTYYVASARGPIADWYCNILSYPNVIIEVAGETFPASAQAITDPKEIADFFELRLSRHPHMIGSMMRFEGLPDNYTREDLEEFASTKALVVLMPVK
jgi:deazaflavin-dependent oxidoreductase (nitroreductase family)